MPPCGFPKISTHLIHPPQVGVIYRCCYWPYFENARTPRYILLLKAAGGNQWRCATTTTDADKNVDPAHATRLTKERFPSAYKIPNQPGILPPKDGWLCFTVHATARLNVHTVAIDTASCEVLVRGEPVPIIGSSLISSDDRRKLKEDTPATYHREFGSDFC